MAQMNSLSSPFKTAFLLCPFTQGILSVQTIIGNFKKVLNSFLPNSHIQPTSSRVLSTPLNLPLSLHSLSFNYSSHFYPDLVQKLPSLQMGFPLIYPPYFCQRILS